MLPVQVAIRRMFLGGGVVKRGRGGIQYEDVIEGAGPPAGRGSKVQLRYSIRLNRGETVIEDDELCFRIGERRVIPGIEYGVEGMRPGGRRRLRIGPHLAYGEDGVPGKVPSNAVLEVDVLLVATDGNPKRP